MPKKKKKKVSGNVSKTYILKRSYKVGNELYGKGSTVNQETYDKLKKLFPESI